MLKFVPQSTARIKLLLLNAQNNKSVHGMPSNEGFQNTVNDTCS